MNRIERGHQFFPFLLLLPAAALAVHRFTELPPRPLLWTVLVVAIVALTIRLFARGPTVWIALFAVGIGMFGLRAHDALDRRLTPAMEGVDYTVVGTVTSMVTRFPHGRRFSFRITGCALAGGPCPEGRQVRLSWYGSTPHPVRAGQQWRLNLRLKRPHGLVNPGGFDRELRALQAGLDGFGYVRKKRKRDNHQNWRPHTLLEQSIWSVPAALAAARDKTQAAMMKALTGYDKSVAGTLVALVTGNQSAIAAPVWDTYNRTGTSHLMSISGLHVTMFAALAVGLARRALRLRWLVPLMVLKRLPAPLLAWLAGLLAALVYSGFSGWGIPAQRTCWMLAAAGLVALSGRASGVPVMLAWAAAVVTLFDPWAPLSTGFWLSFVAVAAIILVAQGHGSERASWLKQAVRTQWAATVALIPLGAIWFGSLSVVSPLANALAIPVISILVTPLALIGGALAVVWPAIGAWPLILAAWICTALLSVLTWAAQSSQAIWITGQPSAGLLLAGVLGALVLLWPGAPLPRLVGLGFLLPLLLLPPARLPHGDWQMLALDVGQGSSILIRTRRHSLLFDTGPSYSADSGAGDRLVAPLMRGWRVVQLDKLVLSHRDADHTGGAHHLLRQFSVSQVLSSIHPTRLDKLGLPAHSACVRGLAWHWDGVDFEFLHPGAEMLAADSKHSNSRSCVLRVRGSGGSALLAGDIESKQEKLLTTLYGHPGLQSDVLLVAHHGSATSSSEVFIDSVAPSHAIFQVGYRNRFGHPPQRVQARYRERGIEMLRSDRDGAVQIDFAAGRPISPVRYRNKNRRYWRLPVE